MNSDEVKILLVEDNPADARLIREMLREVPHFPCVLENADRLSTAFDLLSRRPFDVVLMDLCLPDSQGIETFTRMHETHAGVPVVVLSGSEDDALALEAVQSGAQDYLVKGWNPKGEPLARTLRYAIERKRSEENLRAQSIRDPLTGLFNRRYMEESLHRELQRARRYRLAVSAAMLDIDHFKGFNDRFGHSAGDAVLRTMGRLLVRNFRAQDIPCRYGGEEFTLILPDALPDSARKRCEALREELEETVIRLDNRWFGPVTVSIGIAAYPEHAETADTLLAAADAALYRAKSAGRNCVVMQSTAENARETAAS